MANTLRGLVKEVRQPKSMTTKNGLSFTKRDLILDCTRFDPYTGERGFDNFPCVTFAQDRCALCDGLLPGMVVEVSIDINGRFSPEKNEYYNDVRGYKVEVLRQSAQQQAASPVAPLPAVVPPYPQAASPVAPLPAVVPPYPQAASPVAPLPAVVPPYPAPAPAYPASDINSANLLPF